MYNIPRSKHAYTWTPFSWTQENIFYKRSTEHKIHSAIISPWNQISELDYKERDEFTIHTRVRAHDEEEQKKKQINKKLSAKRITPA